MNIIDKMGVYFLSPFFALIFSPLLIGIINKTKAFFAGRKGASIIQPYFDIGRLLRKGVVYSKTTSSIFKFSPVIIFLSVFSASAFVPFLNPKYFLTGDIVIILYLLGVAKFFMILSALDTGSSFEGMGASREAFFSALAEPVIFICLLNIMLVNKVNSLGAALSFNLASDSISVILSALPLFLMLLVENARIPFDDPNTHLELTMIHEVMILDNSGPDLALIEYASAIKLWIFTLIIAKIFLPIANSIHIVEIVLLAIIMLIITISIGIVESVMARVKLLKIPQLILGAGIIAMLGFFINISGMFYISN